MCSYCSFYSPPPPTYTLKRSWAVIPVIPAASITKGNVGREQKVYSNIKKNVLQDIIKDENYTYLFDLANRLTNLIVHDSTISQETVII